MGGARPIPADPLYGGALGEAELSYYQGGAQYNCPNSTKSMAAGIHTGGSQQKPPNWDAVGQEGGQVLFMASSWKLPWERGMFLAPHLLPCPA